MLNALRAYDYHPAFSSVLMDHWRRFDAASMRAELAELRRAHPDANAVRLMHSYDAYLRDPARYLRTFEEMLSICESQQLRVISCLFNRWHDAKLDCGGGYLEYLIPGLSWAYKEGFFAPYLADVCQTHAEDARICLWEICNKPYGAYSDFSGEIIENHLYEKRWLREMYCFVKQTGTSIPIAISAQDWFGPAELAEMADCCDVLLRSPYYMNAERSRAVRAAQWPSAPVSVADILDVSY